LRFNGAQQVPATGPPLTVQNVPPPVPRVVNDTGPPTPPSGFHPSVSPQAVFTDVGALAHPQPSSEPAPNIHGLGARAVSLVGRLFGRDRGSEFA
jgi:hypothetical protein